MGFLLGALDGVKRVWLIVTGILSMVQEEHEIQICFLSCKHTERQVADLHWVYGDAWEWIWDPFWSVTMHSNGTLPLDALLDARCVHTLTLDFTLEI